MYIPWYSRVAASGQYWPSVSSESQYLCPLDLLFHSCLLNTFLSYTVHPDQVGASHFYLPKRIFSCPSLGRRTSDFACPGALVSWYDYYNLHKWDNMRIYSLVSISERERVYLSLSSLLWWTFENSKCCSVNIAILHWQLLLAPQKVLLMAAKYNS